MKRMRIVMAAALSVSAMTVASAQREGGAFTLSPNRPYVAERGKLQFHNPLSVDTGGAMQIENRAQFAAFTPAQVPRYLRVGLKTEAGRAYLISCAVKSAGAGTFEVVGPDFTIKAPLGTPVITFTHSASISHWAWITIAAQAPWTFHSCTVNPKVKG